jgi:hypothetical protein
MSDTGIKKKEREIDDPLRKRLGDNGRDYVMTDRGWGKSIDWLEINLRRMVGEKK